MIRKILNKFRKPQVELPAHIASWEGDWEAVANPSIRKSKAARKAQLAIWMLRIALPISVVSIIISFAAFTASEDDLDLTAIAEQMVQQPSTSAADPPFTGVAAAENAVRDWLASEGYILQWTAPWWQYRSRLACSSFFCEIHIIRVSVIDPPTNRSHSILVNVVVDGATGVVIGGTPTIRGIAPSLEHVSSCAVPASGQEQSSPTLQARLEEWALAWSANDQTALRDVADDSTGQAISHLGDILEGWEYVPASLEIGDACQAPNGRLFIVVALDLVPEDCPSCLPLTTSYELSAWQNGPLRWTLTGPFLISETPILNGRG